MRIKKSYFAFIAFAFLGGCNYVEYESDRPFLGKKPAPLPIEYSDYKYIDDTKEFGDYTIEKLDIPKFTVASQSINTTTNNILIEFTTEIDERINQNIYLKINTSGDIIDRHEFTENTKHKDFSGFERIVDGVFLVNQERGYYNTWPLNGDKTPKPFTPINKDLAWSAEQVDNYSKKIINENNQLYSGITWESTCDQGTAKRISKIYYLKNTGKWYVLYGNSLTYSTLERTLPLGYTLFKQDIDGYNIPPSNITIPHFQKQKYSRFCSSNQTGCTTAYAWDGTGYYNLAVGDSVLKFKNNESFSSNDGEVFPPKETKLGNFAYYTNPNLKYSLFYAKNALYLLKKK